jgi:hypothetical protein
LQENLSEETRKLAGQTHIGNDSMPPFVASRDPHLTQTSKSTDVIARFGLRLIAIVALAAFCGFGFARSLTVLLWMCAILSAVLATFERDNPLGSVLNHWDESMAYAALCCVASG